MKEINWTWSDATYLHAEHEQDTPNTASYQVQGEKIIYHSVQTVIPLIINTTESEN